VVSPGPGIPSEYGCEDARFQVSLALDGALRDDVQLDSLWDHLGSCPACALFAAQLGFATSMVRSAPRELFRCELTSPRVLRSRLDARRGPVTSVAVVLVAVVLGASQTPGGADAPDDTRQAVQAPRSLVASIKLPIGQRCAGDEFLAGAPAHQTVSGSRPS
jgi:hypothetical protein